MVHFFCLAPPLTSVETKLFSCFSPAAKSTLHAFKALPIILEEPTGFLCRRRQKLYQCTVPVSRPQNGFDRLLQLPNLYRVLA
jgi:hypothetical protein